MSLKVATISFISKETKTPKSTTLSYRAFLSSLSVYPVYLKY